MSSGQAWDSVSQPSIEAPKNDLLEKLEEVANRAKNFTGAGGAVIAPSSGGEFVVCVSCGTSLEVGATLPLPASFVGFARAKGNVLRCGDTDKEATIDASLCRAARIKSMLVAPIGELSSVAGVLAVFSSAANAFTETHVAVLKTLAEVISHLLPDKESLRDLTPANNAVDILDHGFNPAVDTVSEALNNPSAAHDSFDQYANRGPIATSKSLNQAPGAVAGGAASAPPWRKSRESEALPLGAAVDQPSAPEIRKKTTVSRVTPTISTPSRTQGTKPNAVLDLTSNPFTKKALIGTKPRSSRPVRPLASANRISRRKNFKKFYAAMVASLAVAASSWAGYSHFVIDKTSAPSVVASSVAPLDPRAVPIPEPDHRIRISEIKNDLITATTVTTLWAASPKPAPVTSARERDINKPTGSRAKRQRIVIARPAAPVLRSEEPASPEVHVATSSPSAIGDVLKASPAPITPVFKVSKVLPSELIFRVPATYPENARRYGVYGTVVVSATITKTGSVGDVRAVSGPPMLYDAAISAVRKWRYKPSLADGKPIDSTVEITFQFNAPR